MGPSLLFAALRPCPALLLLGLCALSIGAIGCAHAQALADVGRCLGGGCHHSPGFIPNIDVRDWSSTADDSLYLVDVASREMRIDYPRSRRVWPRRLGWSPDGAAVWIEFNTELDHRPEREAQRIDVATGERRTAASIPAEVTRGVELPFRPPRCASSGAELLWHGPGGDQGLELATPDGGARVVVAVEGRVRVHHGEGDADETIDQFFFTPSCRYVVFTFGPGRVWIADTVSGAVGPVTAGSRASLDLRPATPP